MKFDRLHFEGVNYKILFVKRATFTDKVDIHVLTSYNIVLRITVARLLQLGNYSYMIRS